MVTTSQNGRATSTPSAKAVGVSGTVQYGGVLYPADYDKAWKGLERDRTIQSMLNDPLIGAVLLGIEMLVRRVDWTVQAADESTAAVEAATFVDECLQDMVGFWPGDTLAQILTFLGWGWSCLEITHKHRAGATGTPSSRHDDGKIGWHKWALRPQSTRYGWGFEGDDAVSLIQQDPQTYQRITIPLDKCLLFRFGNRDNSPEGTTPLRIAFDAWYFKRQLQKIEAIGIERDLAGLPVMYIPGSDISANSPVYLAAQQIVTGIRNDSQSGAVIAGDRDQSGYRKQELVLLSSGGQRAFDTDVVIKRYANEVVTSFLANVLRTGQDATGSYALAETQGGLFQQAIGAHLDTVANTINEQAVIPLLRLNGFDDEFAPTLVHGDIESADLERLGTYFTALANAGLLEPTPELKVFLHEVAGLPVPSIDELQAAEDEAEAMQQQQPPPPPQTGENETTPTDDENVAPGAVQQAYADLFPAPVNAGDDIEAAVALFRKHVTPEWRDLIRAEVE